MKKNIKNHTYCMNNRDKMLDGVSIRGGGLDFNQERQA